MIGDNVKKCAQLFPSAVKDGEVNFEALKEGLGTFTEVGTKKRRMNIISNSRKKNKTFDVAEGSDLQIEATGILLDAKEALASLRRKHGSRE